MNLAEWAVRRARVRHDIVTCLGYMPPTAHTAHIVNEHDRLGYRRIALALEPVHTETIPAVLLLPKNIQPPFRTVLYLHAHGARYDIGKGELFEPRTSTGTIPADDLTARGFAVMCIDVRGFEERQGRGPDDPSKTGVAEEMSWFKKYLWEGQTLWGMILRDDLISLAYLHSRDDIGPIGVAGFSMGSTRAWWLAALDETIVAVVAVGCLTHYESLLRQRSLDKHSIYYFVPNLRNAITDSQDILGLIAPRPLLALTGDSDPGSPVEGLHIIERAVHNIYGLFGQPSSFRNIVYPGIEHVFTQAMWTELATWMELHL